MVSIKNNLKIGTSLISKGYTLQNNMKITNKFRFIIIIKRKRDTNKYFINNLRL